MSEVIRANERFPSLALPDKNDKLVRLENFSGKLVMLNYWATWCAPCVAEMPAMERMYQIFKDRGLVVIAVNVDPLPQREKVRQFIERFGLTFPILFDPDLNTPPKLGITGFPESFFIDPSGKAISFLDPQTKRSIVRIISERPWDSEVYLAAITSLLEMHLMPRPDDSHNS